MAERRALQKALLIGAVSLVGICATDAAAFDGERKGFTVQFGLGAGYVRDNTHGSSGAAAGATINVGYGLNDRLALFFSERAAAWQKDSRPAALGVSGLGATFYFAEVAPSGFFTGTVGSAFYARQDYGHEEGFGISIGGGYEFKKNWSLGVDYLLGRFSPADTGYGYSVDTGYTNRAVAVKVNHHWY
jgi:hypothetical protein